MSVDSAVLPAAKSGTLLPTLPPTLFHVQAQPLETFLSEFVSAVSQQMSSMQEQLNEANATIASMHSGAKSSQVNIQNLQQMVANNTMQHVTKASLSGILKKLAAHLNEMDPTYDEDTGVGSATWLVNAISVPQDNPSSSPTAASRGTLGGGGGGGAIPSAASPRASGTPKFDTPPSQSGVPAHIPPKRTGAFGDAKLRGFVRAEINAWYQETGLPEAEMRHTRSLAALSKQLTGIKDSIADKVGSGALASAMEVVKADTRAAREEGAQVKKRLQSFEADMREHLDVHHERLLAAHQHGSTRIDQMYHIFGLQEPLVPRPALLDAANHRTSLTTTPTTGADSGLPLAIKRSTSNETSRSESRSSSATARRRSSGAPLPPAPTVASDDDTPDGDDNSLVGGRKSTSVLSCGAFVALRQRILDDIVERISSSRHSQASDMGLEMYAIRNDVKQRPTTQRVLEMIGEQVNIPSLIARCDQLAKQLSRMEREVVNHADFNVALKTKADVVAMEQRISREEQEVLSMRTSDRIDDLEARMKLLMEERQELGRVFKDVVAFHKRDGGGGTRGHQGSVLSGSLNASSNKMTPIGTLRMAGEGDDAEGHLHAILSGSSDPRASAEPPQTGSRQGPSRGSRKQGTVVKPITDSRSQSQNIPFPPSSRNGGGAAAPLQHHTNAAHSARELPPPLAVSVSPNGPALPFTTNQEAYARVVSEDQLRAQMEHLPPIPYERASLRSS